MNRTLIAAIGVVALLGVAACGSDDGGSAASDAAPEDRNETLTVWLMGEADSTWPELVEQVNGQFNETYPNVDVNVQYQQWGDKTTKLDAALGGSEYPDVVELGNTETMTYILNGALAEIDPADYDNSDTWIGGLVDTCTAEGAMYCVPYYAGSRVAVYNADMFEEVTGSAEFPATEDELLDALAALDEEYGQDQAYSPMYLAGRNWHAAMSYVAGYGGRIAEYNEDSGEWEATLSTPEAQAGIEHYVDLVKEWNRGDQTKDEEDHALAMAQEKSALIYGNGWEAGVVVHGEEGNEDLDGVIQVAGMPGPNGEPLPSFIGGSDLAIIEKSDVKDLAAEWIAMFTSEESMEVLASKDTLPNNTKQLEPLKDNPVTAPMAHAVPDAWFTPIAPGWSMIEQQGVLQNMLLDVLRGTPVEEATAEADEQINKLINSEV
ncbi:extracellular solute-binding protein [Streptomyces sp. ACA25]|uniref:extracellular solute-binding protein n=1 Tax=Streptomyces sp. ACA25 TaxID=3022596 RepID=UPI0023079D57|nr:extracellular solute-binding protein [Streptomyces sp. ACA25]MDB1087547.1 extracellular solute-binding protein [Streptomyces sp. ACA25]